LSGKILTEIEGSENDGDALVGMLLEKGTDVRVSGDWTGRRPAGV